MILFSLRAVFGVCFYNFNFLHQAFFQLDHFIFKISTRIYSAEKKVFIIPVPLIIVKIFNTMFSHKTSVYYYKINSRAPEKIS